MPAGATEADAFPARKSGRPRRTSPADTDKVFRGRHFPEDFPQRKLREPPPTTRDGPGRIVRKAPAPAAKRKGGREPLTAPACRGAGRTDGRRVRRVAQLDPCCSGEHGTANRPDRKRNDEGRPKISGAHRRDGKTAQRAGTAGSDPPLFVPATGFRLRLVASDGLAFAGLTLFRTGFVGTRFRSALFLFFAAGFLAVGARGLFAFFRASAIVACGFLAAFRPGLAAFSLLGSLSHRHGEQRGGEQGDYKQKFLFHRVFIKLRFLGSFPDPTEWITEKRPGIFSCSTTKISKFRHLQRFIF